MDQCTEGIADGGGNGTSSPPSSAVESMSLSTGTRDNDVFHIPPLDALKVVTAHFTELARITGDVPATPLAQQTRHPYGATDSIDNPIEKQNPTVSITELHWADAKDASPEANLAGIFQHNVLAKRFFSKKAPPISLEEYLLRLHKYCPMSTAVYLAASLYITRMVIVEKALFVTPRNVHRLVLAGLRVAMKALEDLSYPHSRFARVGGVTERELTRLEITFCFLTDFALRVDARALMCQFSSLRGIPHTDITLNHPPLGEIHEDATVTASTTIPTGVASGAAGSQT